MEFVCSCVLLASVGIWASSDSVQQSKPSSAAWQQQKLLLPA
jgi:hypothetical protein